MASKCECDLWKANIDKVNAPNMFLHARNPTTYKGYDGEPFHFCPWCGEAVRCEACDTPAPWHLTDCKFLPTVSELDGKA
jgi:hypothetical protein